MNVCIKMEWLNQNFPTLRSVDVEYTMRRYDFPDDVCEWIKNTWTKTSEENGGTYSKPSTQLNHTALNVLKKEGIDAAAKHMMSISGMDYGRMRMDYG
jgi:hypothetical protein